MLFNFSLALSSSAEVLPSDLALRFHPIILTLFPSSLIASSSLTEHSLLYSIRLHTHVEYVQMANLCWLAKTWNLWTYIHLLLIFVITLSNALPLAPIVFMKIEERFHNFKSNQLILCLDNPLLYFFADLHMSELLTCYPLSVYQ